MRLKPLALLVSLLLASPAAANEAPPKIWEVPFGSSISALGSQFVDPACGTNGGPPSVALASFSDFATCPVEPNGLREIWFRYDDVLEFMALAYRSPVAAKQNRLTAINGQMAILSFLVDEAGGIRGYRVFTDPQAPERERYDAHVISATLRAVQGINWTCTQLPPGPGEEPIEGNFVKSECSYEDEHKTAHLTADFHLKAGQQVLDSAARRMVNSFASEASIEVIAEPPYGPVAAVAPVVAKPLPEGAGQRERFLAGLTSDCPGCDLSGADLRRRDLSGGDLSGASLTKAALHRATLRGTNFSGANLETSNLNAADLTQANFTGANLSGALLYRVRGSKPVFANATLSRARLAETELRQADFSGTTMEKADFGGVRINGADLSGAVLTGSYFYQASLIRARMTAYLATDSNFTEANMRDADLQESDFHDADLQKAILQGADLSGAQLTHVRLLRANLRDAITEGTDFTGSMMPDGSDAP